MWITIAGLLERALAHDRADNSDGGTPPERENSGTDSRQTPTDDRPPCEAVVMESSRGQRLVLTEPNDELRDPTGETHLSAGVEDVADLEVWR